ncbi:MAG: glutathione S-transferase family protein [Rhodospirillaceae bacterium]|nr:glutathione S-transferase family protein [Rhodospirillaceae bacterium]
MSTELHLILGNKAYSSWSMRPWFAMKVQGLTFKETVLPLFEPETVPAIKKFSGAGKVPVLIHGGITVWDSLAILEYLADAFFDKAWWPTDPHARAVARAVSAEMHSGFQPLRQNMGMNVRKSYPGKGLNAEVQENIDRIQSLWGECRAKFGAGGPFLFGAFSNADAMYAPVVTRFKTYGVKLNSVSQAYCDAVMALPAMKQWYAEAAQEKWVIEKYEFPA